jgi:hypothetical protein
MLFIICLVYSPVNKKKEKKKNKENAASLKTCMHDFALNFGRPRAAAAATEVLNVS